MSNILKLILITVLLILALNSYTQNSQLYTNDDYYYRLATELFEKQKYAQAQFYFEQVIASYGNEHTDTKADAEYFAALCALELFNNDAGYRITNFMTKYPESVRTRFAYYEMGRFKYRQKDYPGALTFFEKVWKQHLAPEQLNEYFFKRGYCYFKTEQNDKASKMFYEIINKESKYKTPAIYYYAHLAYIDGNYETALNNFKKLENDQVFAAVVPYYIVQIYYLQGKTQKVLEYGPQLIEQTESKRNAEIARLVGEALYKNGQYAEALPYLEKYKQNADTYTRHDIYQLGYVQYMDNQLENAINTFNNITNTDDELAQNAFFHIAHCYLKLDKKEQAMKAFEASSKAGTEGEIKEVALLNYAKLSYELSYSPFNETINAFHNYLANYPNSVHKDEVYSYLAKVYLTSKNYKDALASINQIKTKTPEMLEAYQRVSFYRGLELFNNLMFDQALSAFNLSVNQKPFDKQMHALAIYWKAETLYRLKKYEQAAESFNSFLLVPGAYSLNEYNLAYYNLGYCYFKLNNYNTAVNWYRKYTSLNTNVDAYKKADALIRTADCYFMLRQYDMAVNYYGQAAIADTIDQDYAVFQKGFCQGLLKQNTAKTETLTNLINNYPKSGYMADAYYERGRGYLALDSVNNAIADFNSLVKLFPNSSYIVKALLQLGLAHYALEQYQQALDAYKTVVENFAGVQAANDALLGIKNIYVDMNKVDEYFTYAKEKAGIDNITITEKDSLTYIAAEKIYLTGDFNTSAKLLTQYIKTYKNGRFVINANYYAADCYLRNNMPDSALSAFLFVIDKPNSIFTEPALVNAAKILEQNKQYKKALTLYQKLENQAEVKTNLLVARLGQMNCAFNDSIYDMAVEAARKVLLTDKTPEEDIRKTRLVLGKSYLKQNLDDLAITQFRILALDPSSSEGAQANFLVSQMLFNQSNYNKAEESINTFISSGTPHQYWLAKSFILLSNIYLKRNDNFMAKANLQSVIDNYDVNNDGIIDEAKILLASIVDDENSKFIPIDKVDKQPNDTILQPNTNPENQNK